MKEDMALPLTDFFLRVVLPGNTALADLLRELAREKAQTVTETVSDCILIGLSGHVRRNAEFQLKNAGVDKL